jgi:predicted nucleic acid-binding protein
MSWETAWAEAGLARRFVQRLAAAGVGDRRPALAPILDRDPYLSAWTNVEVALGSAPADERARVDSLLAELDAALEQVDMLPSLREAARRAVRALLAQGRLLTRQSLTFVYEPFESAIPLASLGE